MKNRKITPRVPFLSAPRLVPFALATVTSGVSIKAHLLGNSWFWRTGPLPEERENRIPSRGRRVALGDKRSALGWFPLLGERVRVRGKEAAAESSALGLDEVSVPLTPATPRGEGE